MSNLQELETAVQRLSAEELRSFRSWFVEFDAELWDRQMDDDVRAERLDRMAEEALREHLEGRTTEL